MHDGILNSLVNSSGITVLAQVFRGSACADASRGRAWTGNVVLHTPLDAFSAVQSLHGAFLRVFLALVLRSAR